MNWQKILKWNLLMSSGILCLLFHIYLYLMKFYSSVQQFIVLRSLLLLPAFFSTVATVRLGPPKGKFWDNVSKYFADQMPFLLPVEQHQRSKDRVSTSVWLLYKCNNIILLIHGYWTTHGYAISRTGHLVDLSNRVLYKSRTGQLADATGDFACLVFVLLAASARPRVVQSAS